jgi:hypothetical protein
VDKAFFPLGKKRSRFSGHAGKKAGKKAMEHYSVDINIQNPWTNYFTAGLKIGELLLEGEERCPVDINIIQNL